MPSDLSLSDALSHYRGVSDATHRFWGYFQAVAAGAAGFAWLREKPLDSRLLVVLSIAFVVFAVLNWRLIVQSQTEAKCASDSIKAYLRGDDTPQGTAKPNVSVHLQPILAKLAPDKPTVVGAWHIGLSVATVVAIWWRTLFG